MQLFLAALYEIVSGCMKWYARGYFVKKVIANQVLQQMSEPLIIYPMKYYFSLFLFKAMNETTNCTDDN